MKYFIGYPISLHCNLHCPYCFNQEFFGTEDKSVKWHEKRVFTMAQYQAWRDKYLTDGTEFVMHLFGGEPFCQFNCDDVYDILGSVDKEKVDILTNGIGPTEMYEALKKYRHNIHRIGFTFHRAVIANIPHHVAQFENNVLLVRDMGISVYVKELLIKKYREEILQFRKFWQEQHVYFRIQDFKGMTKGLSHEEWKKYTPLDHLIVDREYKHSGKNCQCIRGYKQLFIRGFDMKDVFPKGGDVIACWHDPTVIGNVIEDWYTPYTSVQRVPNGCDVKGVEKLYRGTHERDLPEL